MRHVELLCDACFRNLKLIQHSSHDDNGYFAKTTESDVNHILLQKIF